LLQKTDSLQAEGVAQTCLLFPHTWPAPTTSLSEDSTPTWEFWILIVPGDNACVTTWPCGVTTVTGWYTVPPQKGEENLKIRLLYDLNDLKPFFLIYLWKE
jgi:hypothetical protein